IDANATIKAVNRSARARLAGADNACAGRSLLDFLDASEHVGYQQTLQAFRSGEKTDPVRLGMTLSESRIFIDAMMSRYPAADEELFILIGREEDVRAFPQVFLDGGTQQGNIRRWRLDLATKRVKFDDAPEEQAYPLSTLHPDEIVAVRALF